MLETVDLDDKIGHLFIVPITFNVKNPLIDNICTTKYIVQ